MTDLHTHILPDMDDGSKSVEMSLAMLRAEREQGVDTVALTPHFYREFERPSEFLRRRSKSCTKLINAIYLLSEEEQRKLPSLTLGAEVTWVAGMESWDELRQLCYQGTNYLLLEPPFSPWNDGFIHSLYDMMNRFGIMPVIAHLDRYLGSQKPRVLEKLSALGLPTQISAEPFLHLTTRGRALRCLTTGRAQLLISDCHDMEQRPPNLGAAMAVIQKKLGAEANAIFRETDELLEPDVWYDD